MRPTYRVLSEIFKKNGITTPEIAERMHRKSSQISAAIVALEHWGLVKREKKEGELTRWFIIPGQRDFIKRKLREESDIE